MFPKSESELPELPEGIIMEILLKLPPKSLMRFKCVQKSWDALIKSPFFSAKQLSFSKKHNSSFTTILFRYYNLNVLSLLNLPDDFDDQNLDSFQEDVPIPDSMGLSLGNLDLKDQLIVGHCDGIVCLFDDLTNNIILCNPAIKEFKLLPNSPLASQVTSRVGLSTRLGFGFDHKSKNYKLVKMLRLKHHVGRLIIHCSPKAEIYSLLTNSWKEVETDPLVMERTIIWPRGQRSGAYCKGNLYWFGFEQQKKVIDPTFVPLPYIYYEDEADSYEDWTMSRLPYIVSFDMSDETFHVKQGPPNHHSDSSVYCHGELGLWNESIALHLQRGDDNLEIYVMDEFSAGWTKCLTWSRDQAPSLLTMDNSTSTLSSYYDRNKQLILVFLDTSAVIFYNTHTKKFKTIPHKGLTIDYYSQVGAYVNSIVSIK